MCLCVGVRALGSMLHARRYLLPVGCLHQRASLLIRGPILPSHCFLFLFSFLPPLSPSRMPAADASLPLARPLDLLDGVPLPATSGVIDIIGESPRSMSGLGLLRGQTATVRLRPSHSRLPNSIYLNIFLPFLAVKFYCCAWSFIPFSSFFSFFAFRLE